MTRFFIDPTILPNDFGGFVQVGTLCICYGLLIYCATAVGLGGCRLLLLRLSSIAFSTIIPVFSSLPLASLILASGTSVAEDHLNIGIGALAGSTIGSLSVLWFISVFLGRVTLNSNDELHYAALIKLSPPGSLDTTGTGVSVSPRAQGYAQIGLLSASTNLFVLLPGLVTAVIPENIRDKALSVCAFVALLVCIGLFFTCVWYYNHTSTLLDMNADEDKVIEDALIETIQSRQITLKGAMYRPLRKEGAELQQVSTPLNTPRHRGAKGRLRHLLEPFHQQFADAHGVVDLHGLCSVLRNLGEATTSSELQLVLAQRGRPSSGHAVTYDEFVENVVAYLVAPEPASPTDTETEVAAGQRYGTDGSESPLPAATAQQQDWLMFRAVVSVLAGTVGIILLARPVVEVLYEVSNRTGVSPFTVSFIVAPIISDSGARARDVFRYAHQKTTRSISICLSALLQQCAMNNTLVFAVLVAIIFNRGWVGCTFSAETLVVVLTVAVASRVANKTHQTLRDGLWALALYPLSLLLVSLLQSFGFD